MKSRVGLLATLAAGIVVADQLTKFIAVAVLSETTPPADQPRILGGLVYWSLIRNAGAAFSMATGVTWILALVAAAVVVFIIRIAPKLKSGWWATAFGLILGGAIGNLIDRIFRAPGFLQGHVVDFVSVFGPNAEYFPVFNVADSGISIGAVLLVLTAIRGIDYDGGKVKSRYDERREAADRAAADAVDPPMTGDDGPDDGIEPVDHDTPRTTRTTGDADA